MDTAKFNEKEWLKSLLLEDEALATFTISGYYYPGFCIIPDNEAIEYLDIQAALEETLHRIIGAEAERDGSDPVFCSYSLDQLIHAVLLADTETEEDEDEDEIIDIDLGYRIHGAIMSFERVPLSAVSFQKKLYERYKLFWMIDNGVTIGDALYGLSGLGYFDFDTFINSDYQTDLRLILTDDEKSVWNIDIVVQKKSTTI